MTDNKSDYKKPFMDLVKLLPETYRSDVNISLFNNLFNRFLTKQEIEKISGYIGRGNKNAIRSRQIQEKDVHRQAFQLQPILYDKIGTIEHMASWKDIQNELERLGVDIDDFANWGAVQKFNWVPPIDINKLINYRDFYWVDNNATAPQYITIRNRCAVATARATQWDNTISQYGSAFPIENILEIDDTSNLNQYTIVNITVGQVQVSGDATEDLSINNFFDISGTTSNDGTYQIDSIPTYDGSLNKTSFNVSGLSIAGPIGKVLLRRFDKIVLGATTDDPILPAGSPITTGSPIEEIIPLGSTPNGDYSDLLQPGFILFLRNMSNLELNNSFVKVVSSVADPDNKTTIVTIESVVTDNTFSGGEASLEERQGINLAEKNCLCGEEFGGWDTTLWDDNPNDPLWGDDEDSAGNPNSDGISDHKNLLDRITKTGPPPATGAELELWYDQFTNFLYQYESSIGWKIIWKNFNLLLDATNGFALWDDTSACEISSRIEGTQQWISENKWQHKNDIKNFTGTTRATQPIIEYDWDLELNEWTYVKYNWSYRLDNDSVFEETDTNPPLIELEPIIWWENENGLTTNTTIILDTRYGDLTDWFTDGKQFFIDDGTSVDIFTVDYAEYRSSPNVYSYRTFVTLDKKPTQSIGAGDLNNQKPNASKIYPRETILGDDWKGYGIHWLFLGVDDALPVPHQIINPYIQINQGLTPTQFPLIGQVDYEYTTSLFSQNYTILNPSGVNNFYLIDEIPIDSITGNALETRTLRRKSLFGFNDIRVFASDIIGQNVLQQYGNYDEIGEAVLDVIGIDLANNEIIVGGNYGSYFVNNDNVILRENTGTGTQLFTVSSTAPTNANRIKVSEILTGVTVDGEISNVTTPLPGEDFTNSKDVTIYVMGINFFTPAPSGINIIIQVGAGSINEVGKHYNKVRTLEDNDQYNINGDLPVSLTQYRLVEQVKTKINQYPLFDIFNVDGSSAFKANPIFGYKTSSEFDVNINTGLRIVFDPVNTIYEFDQFILDEDNGDLQAYRDYSNHQENFWYNIDDNTVKFWKDITWSNKTEMADQYRKAIVSEIEPNLHEQSIDGLYWYNTLVGKLFKRNNTIFPNKWIEVTPIDKLVTDAALQTIWKAGSTNDLYIPDEVDWIRRSKEEYDKEQKDFVDARAEQLLIEDPSLSESEAITLATDEWYVKQANKLSEDGRWVGDWEIPDPLYFNHLHENRKFLTSRELLTHFSTIIEEQPFIPGYSGTKTGMFNLLNMDSVNYSLGGTIKEFNDGFDTMLSSVFVNNVTPRSLIEFAHDQYEGLLNSLKEIYRRDAVLLLTNLDPNNILNLSNYVADEVIKIYELNDQAAFVYGDTTTFTDVDGINDLGVRNWIATLPYVNLVDKRQPERIFDNNALINEVVHHDGHRNDYKLSLATTSIISQIVIRAPDSRTSNKTMGESSSNLPPNNITEFNINFGTPISNREGVYWYHVPLSGTSKLYRYIVAESGTIQPSDIYEDGTLWMDLTTGLEVLRIKFTDQLGNITWGIVNGLVLGDGRLHNGTPSNNLNAATISAWQEVNLDTLLNDTIFELENRLYENVPVFSKLAYDFPDTKSKNPKKYDQYLEEAFLDYVSQSQILQPYRNLNFSSSNAFTWNYLRSASGGGINIREASDLTNSFTVSGNITPNSPFFVKNSDVNDGTWEIISTAYDGINNITNIFVEGDVLSSLNGIIYSGKLPCTTNDGSESASDWHALYNEIYGTPYPHLEPWILQGYVDKPDWWDTEYLNDDIPTWGNRKWKYKHGFEIVSANNDGVDNVGTYGVFKIAGDFHTNFISNIVGTPIPIGLIIDNSTSSPGNNGTYSIDDHDTIITVNAASAGTASIVISDIHASGDPSLPSAIYKTGMKISIVNKALATILKTYIIKSAIHSGNIFTITVEEEIILGDISVGNIINGALYDPATNLTEIKIFGLVPAPNDLGRIVQANDMFGGNGFGMWENIKNGIIPPGRSYPNGVISITGNPSIDIGNGLSVTPLLSCIYFSVNIGNLPVSTDGGNTTYAPDDIYPPYWDYISVFTSLPANVDLPNRSLYANFSTEIISPNANYIFGDQGPVEWDWKVSSQYLYDQLTVAYRIDPVRFISSSFGFKLTEMGGLQIDRNTKNTPSHTRTNFHGEVVDNKQFKSDGLNQWYINFNRYSGYDASFSDFRELWTGWKAPITYQFASFIDTASLSINHRFVSVTDFDYNVTSKRGPGVEDFWVDAFKVSITNIPFNIARYNNQLEWRFEVNTNLNISRNIEYYDVHNYQFYANTTDECWLYTWKIQNIDTFNKTFAVQGDQKYVFSSGSQFDIIGSTGNDETYDVITSSYDTITDLTTIVVINPILSAVKDGLLKANYREIPWETGDGVYLSTAELLPIPLLGDTVNGITKYFIIKVSNTIFKLALTLDDADSGIAIDITSSGRRDQFVGQILNTFLADGGARTDISWRLYALDKSNILNFNTPYEVQGMQTMVNIIHGYDSFISDLGWKVNEDKDQLDPESGKIISWIVEIERFITFAYSQRVRREQISDRWPVTVDPTSDIWTFTSSNKNFITGDPVNVFSTNSVYPVPIVQVATYYMIRDTIETFRLAGTVQDAQDGVAINVIATTGVGDLSLLVPKPFRTLISAFEMNPFRNAIWINPPRGIVSNILTGPVEDIRSTQLIFNQNGTRINDDQLRVYRQDKQTKISVVDAVNTGDKLGVLPAYNLLHLGGLHLFIDVYEHVLIFNNYTSEDNLLYDPFIGLNVTKFEMLFNRQPDITQRPNVGGYYLETFFNQGANLNENIESSIENLRNAYDTYNTLESNIMTEQSRKSLGYEGTEDYLSNLNLSEKSQFIFWRGQIQSKGSVNAVNAFINSRRFIDAKIDDFWAIKVGEFGSEAEKEYPEMFTTTVDARSNELRLEFIDNDVDELTVEETFTPIKMSNQERWYNQPDQIEVLRNNGKVLYFDMKAKNKKDVTAVNGSYIRHDLDCDSVEITDSQTLYKEGVNYKIINNNIIQVISLPSSVTIWGMVFNNDSQNPARVIDRESETQITPIQYWDPARGNHYSSAIHNIDLQNEIDPAEYNNTSQTVDYSGIWKDSFAGTSWLNTENLDYIPYYSEQMIPDITERFRSWGQLAEWSNYEIFEWVESDVPPAQWDVLAVEEEGDRTIVEHIRKSGVARKILLEKDNGDWIPAVNKFDELYAAVDGTDNLDGSFTFSVDVSTFIQTGSPLQYIVNVYVNGRLYAEDMALNTIGNTATIIMKESDIVRFVQLVTTDQDVIDAAIADGTMLQEYQFTQVTFYNDLGNIFFKYYFWVNNKNTKPNNRNRTMSIAEAQIQLLSIPSAHMFFQNAVPPLDVVTEDIQVPRYEVYPNLTASGVLASYVFKLPPLSTELKDVLVEVNGADLLPDGIAYTIGGSPLAVTILNTGIISLDPINNEVVISYTGIKVNPMVTLPTRFTQTVIRGLQGVVNADKRYTIRYTRNFTLRDMLDVENERVGSMDLKNLHEEWKIFRQEQQTNIDRWQWDKITESIVKYKLSDKTIRVPSFERELYDEKFGTDTQYGLDEGQTFVNGDLALRSILAYLTDPEVDFSPLDINIFFDNNEFETAEGIIAAMEEIYNTFSFTNVNRMYFSVLKDAFTTKTKYPGIFKTSMVSLHGIRPFQTSGIFDD